ncbi:MAG: 1-acylglycerol-3-phosphate O-acyltransferase [Gemmatimonadetes bacterium]|nr:1-acylglycerol-3-phosphate O-acyltransferase [Gemmatimonadota bacterium]
MFYLRLLAALLGFVAASAYGLCIALFRRDRWSASSDYATVLARLMLPPLGIRLEIRNEAGLYAPRPCVYAGNHQSVLDVPILAACFKRGSVIIAKREVGSIPLFGWIYRATGNLLIDRSDTGQAVGMLKVAEGAIRERNAAVWIFPEGTRGPGDGLLLPFKKGAFRIAVETGAPLVPVVISPLRPDFDIGARRLTPGRVIVQVLEPVHATDAGEEGLVALIELVHARMEAALHALGVEVGRLPAGGPHPTGPRYTSARPSLRAATPD